jgi:hypothetical protein
VSGYETEAYACSVGKALPTVYHWFTATDPFSSNHVVPLSNYDGKGAAAVGTYEGHHTRRHRWHPWAPAEPGETVADRIESRGETGMSVLASARATVHIPLVSPCNARP